MKRTLLLITFALFAFGCATNKKEVDGLKTITNAQAKIVDTGSPLYDGCGYKLVINEVTYHADNLTEDKTLVNKTVTISATITGEDYRCGLTRPGAAGIPIIHITKMDK